MTNAKTITALNNFLSDILRDDDGTSYYIQRKNLEKVLVKEYKFDSNKIKKFSHPQDFLFVIYIILVKCFDVYDKFDLIRKRFINNYLKGVNGIYDLDVKKIMEPAIYFNESEQPDVLILTKLNELNFYLKTVLKNVKLLERETSNEIFFKEDDETFLSTFKLQFNNESKIKMKYPIMGEQHGIHEYERRVKQEQIKNETEESILVKEEEEEEMGRGVAVVGERGKEEFLEGGGEGDEKMREEIRAEEEREEKMDADEKMGIKRKRNIFEKQNKRKNNDDEEEEEEEEASPSTLKKKK